MDDLMQMAKEAGWSGLYTTYNEPTGKPDWQMVKESLTVPVTMEQIERFAELIRKDYSFTHAQMWLKRFDDAIRAENEACAKLCERLDLEGVSLGGEPAPAYGNDCAKAIRERLKGIQSEHCNCPGFCTGACERENV